jgi:hypothetical protein
MRYALLLLLQSKIAGKRIVKANSVPMPQKNAVLSDGFLETADGMQEQ